ncbi:chorismate mutase/chorismate mutase/prephenate dehydrogenase [Streptomyces sp. Amel2xB2]|uniref:chorismate mutase n=1 Tax=Streptomyces sp. Amel2xB2 TaxID=1305829 RepID=UPI000DBA28C5|nr:chorismate mutase [Streptomyces sp. Amel2xB2]RAJ60486.1 chorismate mutase/chorismate mutase/prephenate dehydrogenase [Streptomyces sp. Amel2xB2]
MTEQEEPAVSGAEDDVLAPLRDRLDAGDEQILGLIAQRMETCLEIARLKAEHGIPMMQPSRVGLVVGRARRFAADHGLPEEYLGDLFERIVAETCVQEDVLMAKLGEGSDR